MKPNQKCLSSFVVVAAVTWAGLMVGCGNDVPLGTQNQDGGSPGTGGATATGGVGSGGSNADAALGSGGARGGAGGTLVIDAPTATGGVIGQTGGQIGTGGTSVSVGSGGKIGTGGATGVGGNTSTVQTCGTIAGLGCPAGQFCDLASKCGQIADAGGVCMLTGASVVCAANYAPVCGCDGKTYSNDCTRVAAGVLKVSDGACGGGTGGKIGTGGAGGATGTGGKTGTGGAGGVPGTGGKIGTGGATGAGGSTSNTCGTIAGLGCPAGQFCDLASKCGQIADAAGMCRLTGASVGCTADYVPVCGCDGKTYSNDCMRTVAGVLKAADGACSSGDGGVTTYPTAYLSWEAPGGAAGTGPAVVVGLGWADTWNNVLGFSPETPPSSATGTYTLPTTQTDDLFARLASVNMSSLPRATTLGYECYPRLYFRLCTGCAATTLNYSVPQQLTPDMDPVWLWFDQLLGASASTNPRGYCNWDLTGS